MKVSVILIDGGFREKVFSAEYFLKQNFPADDFEVIWVEHGSQPNAQLQQFKRLNIIALGLDNSKYHSSKCFNTGIKKAKGEFLIIADADQIVPTSFISELWRNYNKAKHIACYVHRYDQREQDAIKNHSFEELERVCKLTNPTNYGSCLAVSKTIMEQVNGYDEHYLFSTGFHANGLDMYTRLKNHGTPIMWHPDLKVFHPWHQFTKENAPQYRVQNKIINSRAKNLVTLPLVGLNKSLDTIESLSHNDERKLRHWCDELDDLLQGEKPPKRNFSFKRLFSMGHKNNKK